MGGGDAPQAPDYAAAAKETAAGNLANARSTTAANRVNTYTPYGSLTYTQDPNNPDKWTSNVELSQPQQKLFNQQMQTSGNLADMQNAATNRVGDTMGTELPHTYDPTQDTNNATQLMMSRLQPQFDRDQQMLDAKLANQGIVQGSEAYHNAMYDMNKSHNDAMNQAALQGIQLGMNQQGQQYQQQVANRNMPMNELNALRTGSQVTNPTFQNAPQQNYVGGPDMLGAANQQYNAQLGAYNARQAGQGNMMSGLFGLGGALIKNPDAIGELAAQFSDYRLKSNIKYVGKFGRHNWYEYDKFGKRETGVMAQEVALIQPEAVITHPSGYMMVNYGALQ